MLLLNSTNEMKFVRPFSFMKENRKTYSSTSQE